MKREDGFYWVKSGGEWVVAQWMNRHVLDSCWWICGLDIEFYDNELEDIGEQIKKPDV